MGYAPGTLLFADLNGDGHADLVAGGGASGPTAWLGNGDGSFQPGQALVGGEGGAIADLNGDGRPDLVTNDFGGGAVEVLLG